MRLRDHARVILLRTSGKGQDESSAQTMKNLRIHRPRAHGRNRPPELAHRHFGHPGGGSGFFFKMSGGSFLEKVDFYRHKRHFLKEAFWGCAEMRPKATPQHNLEGVKKRRCDRFWKRSCCGHREARRVENGLLTRARSVLGGQEEVRTSKDWFWAVIVFQPQEAKV